MNYQQYYKRDAQVADQIAKTNPAAAIRYMDGVDIRFATFPVNTMTESETERRFQALDADIAQRLDDLEATAHLYD